MYSSCCCSCSFEPEIIKIGQSSYKMYSNNIQSFQESTTILNACTKKSGNILNSPRIYRLFQKKNDIILKAIILKTTFSVSMKLYSLGIEHHEFMLGSISCVHYEHHL